MFADWWSAQGFTALQWAVIALSFLLGGVVKGTLGVGLPLVAMPLMSLFIGIPRAIGLLVLPILISNTWQTLDGGMWRYSARRFGPMLLVLIVSTVVSVKLMAHVPDKALDVMLAMVILLAVAAMGLKPDYVMPARWEKPVGLAMGLFSGILGAVSSLTGPFMIGYLMALKLTRDQFVGCISIVYLCSAIPLFGAMAWYGRLGWDAVGVSALMLAPTALGLWAGKWLRGKLSEQAFRRLLLVFLCVVVVALLLK